MRIALAHKRLDLKGGTEKDLYRTAEGLRDLGHEVHLFCCEFGVPAPAGVQSHRLPVLPLGRTARLVSLAFHGPRTIARFNCDVVFSFGRMLRQDVLRCGGGSHRGFLQRMALSGGARRRLWQGISPYHRTLLAIERREFCSGRYKKILAVSGEVKRDLMEQYSVPEQNIAVIYNGVDTERFHPAKRDSLGRAVRRQNDIPDDAPLVLFVGNGFHRKGLDRLLTLWESPKLSEVFLVVLGDDARLSRYQSWAEKVAPGRILFRGRRDDVENFYAAADIVALPSLQEAFGNVVLEALASGLPVLVSASAGAAEVLAGRLTKGAVARADDPNELAKALVGLLHSCSDASLRREARQLAEEYSWPKHFAKVDALLNEVAVH